MLFLKMKPSVLLEYFLLFTFCVSVFCSTTPTSSTSSSSGSPNRTKASRRRTPRCRCKKTILKDLSKIIDKKFLSFQKELFSQSAFLQLSSNAGVAANASSVNRNLEKISGNVAEIKTALRHEGHSLKEINDHLSGQRDDMAALRNNFNSLQHIVQNLTSVVDNMDMLLTASASDIQDAIKVTQKTHAGVPIKHEKDYPQDCSEIYESGAMRYRGDYYMWIRPYGAPKAFKVLCQVRDGAGWTTIQKRTDGLVDFFQKWDLYKKGFGILEGEFWLGNDNIHRLTKQGDTMLRVEMERFNGQKLFAEYDLFRIESEKNLYKLHIEGYHGNAGDSMTTKWKSHDGMAFSTHDRDNDHRYYDNCAQHFHGAWWFNDCFTTHLNGRYYHRGSHKNYFKRDGILWNTVDHYSSLKRVEMMIKPAPTRLSVSRSPTITNEI